VLSGNIVLRAISRIDRTRVHAADRLLTSAETRGQLGCSAGTVENLVRQGFLEKVYLLAGVRYRESDVERIIRQGARRRSRGRRAA
jgi:hypothetical protein